MARQARLVIPDVPHHVVLRGNNRRRLFSYPKEYTQFIYLLGRGLVDSRCKLHAAVLMQNHVHLVVTPPISSGLATLVKRVAQRYAHSRNVARSASGRLFEERFFSRPILSERQLAVTIAYVELNPVRAGRVTKPECYRWSTYAWHAGVANSCAFPTGLWTPTAWYLSLDSDKEVRGLRYAEWLEDCRVRGERPEQLGNVELRSALSAAAGKSRVERPDRKKAT